ncbi:Crp/Fnr family transcriptional regulator [Herbaspirillum sp. GCM10030257]|uniref:Crp/Fnr family transcriptional regulator n=1 Tax=Herbaspirillum sp. GCM10030257 TaxID=3273393 RepID=UPI00360BEE65
MRTVPGSPSECSNLLLSMLPVSEYQALLPHLEFIDTPLHFVLFERDKPINYAYFPLIGEHSILATMEDGSAVEVGTVGYEGMSTIDLLLGGDLAIERTVCQIPGSSLRMPASVFKEMTATDTVLRRVVLKYLQAYLSQVSQSVACNRLHGLEQRMARWLLMSHDRMKRDEFQITQEYLAMMLGVHRPSVSLIAGTLQRAGLIEYKRGNVHIVDREGLEEVACECYGIVRAQFERLLGVRS